MAHRAKGRDDLGGSSEPAARRFRDIPTRWSALRGPPREALDYLYRTYGTAILSYLRARLGRGDFSPLREPDAEDLMQDFFLRIGKTEWLAKPDPARGRFRPYLVTRLVLFVREKRATALGARRPDSLDAGQAHAELAANDPLDDWFEREWKAAAVRECLRRLGRDRSTWRDALELDLRRDGRSDAELAAAMGSTLEAFRSLLKRARKAFRELFEIEERRLDGFGGGVFDAV